MATLEITIDDLGIQGDGIAHYKGTTLFVSGALKGEKVRIDLEENQNLVKRGQLVDILVPSPQRTTPPCPHFPLCGGCRFQHMNDLAYTEFKTQGLEQIFQREKLPHAAFLPTVVTASETRRRARLAASHDKNGITIGFNEWRSHSIVNLKTCPVLKPELVDLIDKLRAYLPLWLKEGQNCDIQMTSLIDGIDIVLIGGPKLDVDERQALGELASLLDVAHLSWKKWDRSPVEPIAHRSPLSVHFGKTKIPFPPGSFLQATQAGEDALVSFVNGMDKNGHNVLDLFCGLGTFGLSLENAHHVHFCDLDGPAVEALGKEAKKNARYSTSLKNLSVDPFTAMECNEYDLVIFDPPRGGAKAQAQQLAKSKTPCIMAVSCDPASFTRDAKILIDGGYALEKILPVDQFLWSSHLELAAKFVR